MKFVLQPILDIRRRREADAARQLSLARSALEQRQRELVERRKELADYLAWCENEAARLFTSLQNPGVTNRLIVEVREQIQWNFAQSRVHQQRIEEAQKALESAEETERRASAALQLASKKVLSMNEQEKEWSLAEAAVEAAAEDSELEEVAQSGFFRNRLTS